MQQEVVLALLAKEPSHGYELRARLRQALGAAGDGLNAGQIYVTLTRLEKAGLVTSEQSAGLADRLQIRGRFVQLDIDRGHHHGLSGHHM